MKKRVALYFGSFNPVHRGHIALTEWVVEQGLCDEAVLIVSPQNPLKSCAELAPEFSRFEMCELACTESKYPDRIKVSAIEFTLEKPSYTFNTQRFLRANFGSEMQFLILIGADNMAIFDRWVAHDEILRDYEIMVYPRSGYDNMEYPAGVHYLADAPIFDYAATEIRDAVGRGENIDDKVCPSVAKYIREHNLWSPAMRIANLNARIAANPDDSALLTERGMWHFRMKEFNLAAADFRAALATGGDNKEAAEFLAITEETLRNGII